MAQRQGTTLNTQRASQHVAYPAPKKADAFFDSPEGSDTCSEGLCDSYHSPLEGEPRDVSSRFSVGGAGLSRAKPAEPLRTNLAGLWSRRIDETNRLVYTVDEGVLTVFSCRYHY